MVVFYSRVYVYAERIFCDGQLLYQHGYTLPRSSNSHDAGAIAYIIPMARP